MARFPAARRRPPCPARQLQAVLDPRRQAVSVDRAGHFLGSLKGLSSAAAARPNVDHQAVSGPRSSLTGVADGTRTHGAHQCGTRAALVAPRAQGARLVELVADDAAAKRSPRLAVAGALLTLSAA